MSDKANPLGDYLRARRGLVTPEQAGIPDLGGRRVSGLRREEVAMLAGISADYYLRLERGRDRNPSREVLESVARVLQLDDEGVAYLLGLAADNPRRRKRRRSPKESVPAGIVKLLATLTQPAFVEDRYFDVLAANELASALDTHIAVGRNQLRDLFQDPYAPTLYPDWDEATACLIASFRQAAIADVDDPRFIELVGELSLSSARFRYLWNRHDVAGQRGSYFHLDHPQVGGLRLNRERLAIAGTEGMMFVVYHPDADSADADKLALLASSALPPAGHRGTRAESER